MVSIFLLSKDYLIYTIRIEIIFLDPSMFLFKYKLFNIFFTKINYLKFRFFKLIVLFLYKHFWQLFIEFNCKISSVLYNISVVDHTSHSDNKFDCPVIRHAKCSSTATLSMSKIPDLVSVKFTIQLLF